jgi:flagellar basal-body rod protein FlgB
MDGITFGSTVSMLKHAMTGASETQSSLANNIANVNTPGFKRTDVSFKDALAASAPERSSSDELAMTIDEPGHMTASGNADPNIFAITKKIDPSTAMREDGSNVDIDQEMAKLSLNSAYAQSIGQLLQNQYTRLRKAISEQP